MFKYFKEILLLILTIGVMLNLYFWWNSNQQQQQRDFANQQSQLAEIKHQNQQALKVQTINDCIQKSFKEYNKWWAARCIELGLIKDTCTSETITTEASCACMMGREDSEELDERRKAWEQQCNT